MLITPHDFRPSQRASEVDDEDAGPDAGMLLLAALEWLADVAAILAVFALLPLTFFVILVWR